MDEAARLATSNFAVLGVIEAIAAVEWTRFLANIRNDEMQITILQQVQQMMMNSWPQVAQHALTRLHESQMEFQEMAEEWEDVMEIIEID